jgi:hypothetical protein
MRQMRQRIGEVGGTEAVATLVRARARQRDQFGKIAVTVAVDGQRNQRAERLAGIVGPIELAADDQVSNRF